MTAPTEVIVHPDAGLLAKAVAARLITRLVDAQAEQGSASWCSPAAGSAVATLRAVRDSPAVEAVDWRRVDIWWGDERFVPATTTTATRSGPRGAARPRRRRPRARLPDGWERRRGRRRRRRRRRALRRDLASRAARTVRPVPRFDVLMLGLGPGRTHGIDVPGDAGRARGSARSWPCRTAPSRPRRASA